MPVETKDGGFPMKLILPAQKVRRTFHTSEEVFDFLSDQKEFWRKLNENRPQPLFAQPTASTVLDDATTTPISRALAHEGKPKSALQQLEQDGAIISDGLYGKFVASTHEWSPEAYPGAVALSASAIRPASSFTSAGQHRVHYYFLHSVLAAISEKLSNDKLLKSEGSLVSDLIAETQGLRDEAETLRGEIADWQAGHKISTEADTEAFNKKMNELIEEATSKLATSLAESNAKILELEDKVRNRLILEAPTTYWNEKARWHQGTAIVFGVIFLATVVGGVWWLSHYGVSVVANAYEEIIGNRQDQGLSWLVPLAFLTIPAIAIGWLLRHVSRVIVQSIALGADARLRGTIATTYSALTAENSATPAELAIALNALFRPIDGSAHAEIAPPNIHDILQMGNKP